MREHTFIRFVRVISLLFAFGLLCSCNAAEAQEAQPDSSAAETADDNAQEGTDATEPNPSPSDEEPENPADTVIPHSNGSNGSKVTQHIVIPLIGAIFAAIAGALVSGWMQHRRLAKAYRPRHLQPGERKNTVLVIGQGRTGKTQLVNSLTQPMAVINHEVTNDFEIKSFAQTDGDGNRFEFDFTDYRGQDFSQLVRSFVKEQLQPFTRIRYGDINSLVLMVDLFPYQEGEPPETVTDDINVGRVKFHLDQWNRTALDAVFGLLTREELNFVCLFINKIDRWENGNAREARDTVLKLFEPLIKDLERRIVHEDAPYAEFQVIVGSAHTGAGVIGADSLLQKLTTHAVTAENVAN